MIKAGIEPYHIKYLDATHLEAVNTLLGEDLFRVNDAVFVEFEEDEERTKFLELAENRGILEEQYLSNYFWHERLFPMKTRSRKPTHVACELIIPIESAVPYLKEVKRIVERCRIDIQVESHIVGKDRALLIVTHLCDIRKPLRYLIHITLIPALTRLGVTFSGVPYGLGIWNTPFIKDKFDKKTLEIYRAYKKGVDPRTILNPQKFFSVRTKWGNIPGILFKPSVFRLLSRAAALVTPSLAKLTIIQEREMRQ